MNLLLLHPDMGNNNLSKQGAAVALFWLQNLSAWWQMVILIESYKHTSLSRFCVINWSVHCCHGWFSLDTIMTHVSVGAASEMSFIHFKIKVAVHVTHTTDHSSFFPTLSQWIWSHHGGALLVRFQLSNVIKGKLILPCDLGSDVWSTLHFTLNLYFLLNCSRSLVLQQFSFLKSLYVGFQN